MVSGHPLRTRCPGPSVHGRYYLRARLVNLSPGRKGTSEEHHGGGARTWTIHIPDARTCTVFRRATAPTGASAGRPGTRPARTPAPVFRRRPTAPARNRSAPAAGPGPRAASAPSIPTTCARHYAASPNCTRDVNQTCAPNAPDSPPSPEADDPRSDTAPMSERPPRHRPGHRTDTPDGRGHQLPTVPGAGRSPDNARGRCPTVRPAPDSTPRTSTASRLFVGNPHQ